MFGKNKNVKTQWELIRTRAATLFRWLGVFSGKKLRARISQKQPGIMAVKAGLGDSAVSKMELNSEFESVERLAADLTRVSRQLEAQFNETANVLMSLDAHNRRFVSHSAELMQVATGRLAGTEAFGTAMQVADPPLTFLNQSHLEMVKLLERLKTDDLQIAALIRGQSDLQNTIAPLKYVQTGFRIASAPMGEEVQQLFNDLTQEIEKMHLRVVELFTVKYDELIQVQRSIAEVIRQLQFQTEAVWKNITHEKKQIDSSLERMQDKLLQNKKRETEIADFNRALTQNIQKVVTGLQFQDIISQRLQHTVTALGEIRRQFDGSDRSIAFLEQASRLETNQIHSTRKDLAHAQQSVHDGIANVIAQIEAAHEKSVSLDEFEKLTNATSGMVEVLLEVFGSLRKQIATTVAGCASAHEVLRPIGGMASGMNRIVTELSLRIHLVGLNAQIQAAQVATGSGLEVLSARTSEISRDTNQIGAKIALELDDLVAGLANSLELVGSLHERACAQQEMLRAMGQASEQQLGALRAGASAALTGVKTEFSAIREQSQQVVHTANYIETADGTLAGLAEKLISVAALAEKHRGEKFLDTSLIAEFKSSYTMASERQIFESVNAPGKNSGAAEVQAPVAGVAEDFGVELFASPDPRPGGAGTAASPAACSGAMDQNVELF